MSQKNPPSHGQNVKEFLNWRMWKMRQKYHELEDDFVDQQFLKSFDGVFNCKWCGRSMRAIEYDKRKGEIIVSCDKPLCPGNATDGPRKMPNWKKYRINEMTNQAFLDERGF